jgi:hypothetical protein
MKAQPSPLSSRLSRRHGVPKGLMLIKPTRPKDSAGNIGDYLATHNGGQRWHGNEQSPQYHTILE